MVRGGAVTDVDDGKGDEPPCCRCTGEIAELRAEIDELRAESRDRLDRVEASLRIAAGALAAIDDPPWDGGPD